jgi:hypothetical protein
MTPAVQRPPPETPCRLQESLTNYSNRPTAQRGAVRCSALVELSRCAAGAGGALWFWTIRGISINLRRVAHGLRQDLGCVRHCLQAG